MDYGDFIQLDLAVSKGCLLDPFHLHHLHLLCASGIALIELLDLQLIKCRFNTCNELVGAILVQMAITVNSVILCGQDNISQRVQIGYN